MDFPAPYPQENALLDLLATARADVDRAAAGLAAVQGAGASSSEPATATAATASAVAEAAAWLAAVGQALTKGRALLKEFEQEARLDGMPPPTLAARRRPLAEQLAALAATRAAALSTASTVAAAAAGGVEDGGGATTAKAKAKGKAKAAVDKPTGVDALSAPELIAAGRTLIAETDASLLRSARVVAQTMEVGSKTAAALSDQAAQLERILDDADAMRGAARKARRVIVEVARGAATDRCIALLILLVAGAGVAALALRIKYGGLSPGSTNPAAAPAGGRRLLLGGGSS